ncbi:MAG: hypothetical protein AAF497_02440 [Planctomycetota bacterium]
MKKRKFVRLLVTVFSAGLLASLMTGCEQFAEGVQGSGTFTSADGATTSFEIDTCVNVELEDNGEYCTNLAQYGTATFIDCDADIRATINITPADQAQLDACNNLLSDEAFEGNEDVEEFQNCLELLDDDVLSYRIGLLSGMYELRSCQERVCDVYQFIYFPCLNYVCYTLVEEDIDWYDGDSGHCFQGCGYSRRYGHYYYGWYFHCEGNDEVLGTGCLFAAIGDGLDVTTTDPDTGETTTVTTPDRISLILVDDVNKTVVYQNCGDVGEGSVDSIPFEMDLTSDTITSACGNVYNNSLSLCPEGSTVVIGDGDVTVINIDGDSNNNDGFTFVDTDPGTITVNFGDSSGN